MPRAVPLRGHASRPARAGEAPPSRPVRRTGPRAGPCPALPPYGGPCARGCARATSHRQSAVAATGSSNGAVAGAPLVAPSPANTGFARSIVSPARPLAASRPRKARRYYRGHAATSCAPSAAAAGKPSPITRAAPGRHHCKGIQQGRPLAQPALQSPCQRRNLPPHDHKSATAMPSFRQFVVEVLTSEEARATYTVLFIAACRWVQVASRPIRHQRYRRHNRGRRATDQTPPC